MTTPWSWRLRAACAGADPALFFPEPGERPAVRRARERIAKALCHRCPVTEECVTFALGDEELDGVWGGLSARERRALQRRAAQAA